MTPLARITAAIEKLEEAYGKSWGMPWHAVTARPNGQHWGLAAHESDYPGIVHAQEGYDGFGNGTSKFNIGIIELMTQPALIECVLTSLRVARRQIAAQGEHFKLSSCDEPGSVSDALDLADAILGGES